MTTRRVIVASVLLWAAALLAGCASSDSTGARGSGTPSAGRQDPAAGPALPDSAARARPSGARASGWNWPPAITASAI